MASGEGQGSAAADGSGGKVARSGQESERYLGLGVRESLMLWTTETTETEGENGEGLWWRDAVEGFKILSDDDIEMELAGMGNCSPGNMDEPTVFAVRYESVCINVPRYLEYLMGRVETLGARFVKAKIKTKGGVEGVVEGVLRVAKGVRPRSKVDAVVLATGLLSKDFLPKEEADKLYPVRGQTVLVKGEAKRAITEIFKGGEIIYIIPRPGSGTTIIGGYKQVGNWDDKEDVELTKEILRRARVLDPELTVPPWSGEKFEVLSVQVGRRPGRKGGPRVEMGRERVKEVRVVHAYGHEGAGYQNSVGSAEKVVRLLAEV